MSKNIIPEKRLKLILKSFRKLDPDELIRKRQAWQNLASLTRQDRHIIMMLDRELDRRGIVPPILSNVIPGRNRPRGREVS